MSKSHPSLEQGILFYATLYISGLLIAVFLTTGRWIFLLVVFLTLGLSVLLNYATLSYPDHLSKIGLWSEKFIKSSYEKLTSLFKKA